MAEIAFDISNIQEEKILLGDLYWHKKSGPSLIGKCGDLANIDLISKLHSGGSVLSLDSFANLELIEKHSKNLELLKNAEDELARVRVRKEIVQEFSDIFINDVKNGNLIDWWMICYKGFYDLPEDVENKLAGNSLILYKRALAVSSLTVILAMAFGYLHYDFLKDLYNAVFMTDLELLDESNYSPSTISRLEHGRAIYLDESVASFYVAQSFQIKRNLKKIGIENDAIYLMLKFHHERLDSGRGPFKLFESELNDLGTLYSFVQRIFPYKEIVCKDNDARGLLIKHFKSQGRFIKMKKLFEAEFKEAR